MDNAGFGKYGSTRFGFWMWILDFGARDYDRFRVCVKFDRSESEVTGFLRELRLCISGESSNSKGSETSRILWYMLELQCKSYRS